MYEEVTKKIISTPDKSSWKTTTTQIFKINVFGFLLEVGIDKTILELGSAQGHSTFYLAGLCKHIYATDISKDNCKLIENLNLKNCTIYNEDIYSKSFLEIISKDIEKIDITIIDAVHKEKNVFDDSIKGYNLNSKYFIYDDIGLIPEVKNGFEKFINFLKEKKHIIEIRNIGAPPGAVYNNTGNKILTDFEGKILIIKDR